MVDKIIKTKAIFDTDFVLKYGSYPFNSVLFEFNFTNLVLIIDAKISIYASLIFGKTINT